MAKFKFIEKLIKKDATEDKPIESTEDKPIEPAEKTIEPIEGEPKKSKEEKKNEVMNLLYTVGAEAIDLVDESLIEAEEIAEAGIQGAFKVCGSLVDIVDQSIAIAEWAITKAFVYIGRKVHDVHVLINKHRKMILKNLLILGAGALVFVMIFSWSTDYEYSYHGRALGIVEEQRDVIEILELASEELSKEYGSSINIDPETDITFRPVVSSGKEIDNQDTVLKRLTYMGEINAQVAAIMVDGKPLVIVESEAVAEDVLQKVKDTFVKDTHKVEYEYIGFAEDVKVEPYTTTLKNVSGKNAAYQKLLSGGQAAVQYTVKDGDTLYDICIENDLSMSDLETMNPGITKGVIRPGDKINLQKVIPLLTIETIEVSTYAEKVPYETKYENSDFYYQGETVLSRSGVDGKDSVTARITKRNGEVVEKQELKRERIVEPINEILLKGTKKAPPSKGTGTFIMPANGVLTSEFGYRWGRNHDGIDIGASTGTAIRASDGGTVILSEYYYGYGLTIIIDHGGGYKTLYGHNNANYVTVGQKVFQGQTIGEVGNTGNSTGPHLHFEIMYHGTPVNPYNYF